MIDIKDKKDCCGCWACKNVCPVQCITMPEDEEGFRYPTVDKDKCINCHLCEKVCPIINKKEEPAKPQKAYVVQNKDPQVLRESTSGGAFSAIAKAVIRKGGIVFGAGFDTKGVVRHQAVEKEEDLRIFRNSKYVQSLVGDTYKQVKDSLKQGRLVLFSGTPCQLEGLIFYLREKHYDNLLLIDVVCRAVPSPLVLRKYEEMQQKKMNSEIDDIKFRDKYHGYKYSSLSIRTKDKQEYHEGIDTDPYLRAFFAASSIRPSCTQCKFRSRYRRTDMTLWDCFTIEHFSKELDNDKGATRILVHTQRGADLLNSLVDDLKIVEVNPEDAVDGVKEMLTSPQRNVNCKAFFQDIHILEPEAFFTKYYPNTLRHRLEKQARLLSNKLGIYKYAKKVVKAIIGKREIKR